MIVEEMGILLKDFKPPYTASDPAMTKVYCSLPAYLEILLTFSIARAFVQRLRASNADVSLLARKEHRRERDSAADSRDGIGHRGVTGSQASRRLVRSTRKRRRKPARIVFALLAACSLFHRCCSTSHFHPLSEFSPAHGCHSRLLCEVLSWSSFEMKGW